MHILSTITIGTTSYPTANFVDVPPDMTDGIANPIYIYGERVGTVTQNGLMLDFDFSPEIVLPYGVCMEVWVQAPPKTCDPITPPENTTTTVVHEYTHKRVDPCDGG